MSLAADVALGAVERVRKSLGPKAGLLAYRTLATNAADAETRGRATLAGLGCALELGDADAAGALVALYSTATAAAGRLEADVRVLVLAMLRRGRAAGAAGDGGWALAAAGLAALESARCARARAAYLHARCLECVGDPVAAAGALRVAEERARVEGADDIVQSARALRVALLHETGAHDRAIALAGTLTLRALPAELLLRLAPSGLASESRFTRATWLGELAELAQRRAASEAAIAARALAIACGHADRLGLALTPLEEDRLHAMFAKLADEGRGARLGARLRAARALGVAARTGDAAAALHALGADEDPVAAACVRRALDVVSGRFEPRVEREPGSAAQIAITACAALRDRDLPRAAAALARLALTLEAAPPAARPPAWEAAYLGLFADSEAVRRDALAVVAAMLRLRVPLPSRGGLALARACRAVSEEESPGIAAELLRLAALAREPGASEAHFEHARELGWRAAQAGDRDVALRWLREAQRASGSAK